MTDAIDSLIGRTARRALLCRVSLAAWWSGLIGGVGAIAYLCILKAAEAPAYLSMGWILVWGAAICLGVALASSRRPQTYATAKLVDDALGLNDRVSSAYSFTRRRESGGFVDLLLQDAAAAAERVRLSDVVPRAAWTRLIFSVCALPILLAAAQRHLFPPPPERVVEVFSEAELGAALSAISMTMDDPQTFQQLQQELQKLGIGETTEKKELLARLNRTISELKQQAEQDESLLTTLAQMEKLKSKLGLAELQMRADEELRQVEQLVTEDGVLAETIFVDPLVDAAKAQEIAKGLKELAQKQLAGKTGDEPAPGVDDQGKPITDPGGTGKGESKEPKTGPEGTKHAETTEDLAIRAISDQAIRARILKAAREADRRSEAYAAVYRNYRRTFLAELFRMDLGSGRREYLERYFYTIRPEGE